MQTKQIKLPVWKNSNASKELLKKDIEEEGLIEVMTAREARSAVTAAGLPPWHESNLERLLLNVFVNQLMHETMSPPPARHESRPEHQEVFSLHAFRQHMQQESHSRKETKCWLNTRTNKSSKNNWQNNRECEAKANCQIPVSFGFAARQLTRGEQCFRSCFQFGSGVDWSTVQHQVLSDPGLAWKAAHSGGQSRKQDTFESDHAQFTGDKTFLASCFANNLFFSISSFSSLLGQTARLAQAGLGETFDLVSKATKMAWSRATQMDKMLDPSFGAFRGTTMTFDEDADCVGEVNVCGWHGVMEDPHCVCKWDSNHQSQSHCCKIFLTGICEARSWAVGNCCNEDAMENLTVAVGHFDVQMPLGQLPWRSSKCKKKLKALLVGIVVVGAVVLRFGGGQWNKHRKGCEDEIPTVASVSWFLANACMGMAWQTVNAKQGDPPRPMDDSRNGMSANTFWSEMLSLSVQSNGWAWMLQATSKTIRRSWWIKICGLSICCEFNSSGWFLTCVLSVERAVDHIVQRSSKTSCLGHQPLGSAAPDGDFLLCDTRCDMVWLGGSAWDTLYFPVITTLLKMFPAAVEAEQFLRWTVVGPDAGTC
jgi:hypothetical protein